MRAELLVLLRPSLWSIAVGLILLELCYFGLGQVIEFRHYHFVVVY